MTLEQVSAITAVRARLSPGRDQMERMIDEVLGVPRSESARLCALWLPLAALLAAHLDGADRHMLPALAHRAEREALSLEHLRLRAQIDRLDAAFSVGTLAPSAVRSFAEEVLAHQEREHALLANYGALRFEAKTA